MSAGYITILFVRDPFKIFIEDYVISHVEKSKRESANAAMGFLYNALRALLTLLFGLILVNSSFIIEFIILAILTIIVLIILIILYFSIKNNTNIQKEIA